MSIESGWRVDLLYGHYMMLMLALYDVTYPSSSSPHPHRLTEESQRAVWSDPEGGGCRELTESVWERSQGNMMINLKRRVKLFM